MGAFGSPQLLLASGIGAKEVLAKFKVPVVKEIPGVGQGLKVWRFLRVALAKSLTEFRS